MLVNNNAKKSSKLKVKHHLKQKTLLRKSKKSFQLFSRMSERKKSILVRAMVSVPKWESSLKPTLSMLMRRRRKDSLRSNINQGK